ncbi:MAG TPA: hypothetical protein VH916_08415, partial [Dehalococcoidia bacterium]
MSSSHEHASATAAGNGPWGDPVFAAGTLDEQVHTLRAAGLREDVIAGLLRQAGVEELDVRGYLTSTETQEPDPQVHAFSACVLGTCSSLTITLGCTKTFGKPSPPP